MQVAAMSPAFTLVRSYATRIARCPVDVGNAGELGCGKTSLFVDVSIANVVLKPTCTSCPSHVSSAPWMFSSNGNIVRGCCHTITKRCDDRGPPPSDLEIDGHVWFTPLPWITVGPLPSSAPDE